MRPRNSTIRHLWTLIAISVLTFASSTVPGSSEVLVFNLSDESYDVFPGIDLISLTGYFHSTTGDYELVLGAAKDSPFEGTFRVNVNLYNPRLGPACSASFFADTLNDFEGLAPTTELRLRGTNEVLTHWQASDRVAVGVDSFGPPDCTTDFATGVQGQDEFDRGHAALVTPVVFPVHFGGTDSLADEEPGAFDVHAWNLQFDPRTGDFEVAVGFSDDAVPIDDVTLVLHAYNSDLGTDTCDPTLVSIFGAVDPADNERVIGFAGTHLRFTSWSTGQRVSFNSTPLGTPDCSSFFVSTVRVSGSPPGPGDPLGAPWMLARTNERGLLFSDGFESGDAAAWFDSSKR